MGHWLWRHSLKPPPLNHDPWETQRSAEAPTQAPCLVPRTPGLGSTAFAGVLPGQALLGRDVSAWGAWGTVGRPEHRLQGICG